jgi:hypothetical protein
MGILKQFFNVLIIKEKRGPYHQKKAFHQRCRTMKKSALLLIESVHKQYFRKRRCSSKNKGRQQGRGVDGLQGKSVYLHQSGSLGQQQGGSIGRQLVTFYADGVNHKFGDVPGKKKFLHERQLYTCLETKNLKLIFVPVNG